MAVNFSQFKPFHQSPCVNQASFAFCQEFLYFSFLRVNVSISLTLLLTSNPCQFLVFCNIFRCRCYLEFNYVPHCFCFVNYSRHFFQSYFIFSLSHLSFPRVLPTLSFYFQLSIVLRFSSLCFRFLHHFLRCLHSLFSSPFTSILIHFPFHLWFTYFHLFILISVFTTFLELPFPPTLNT